MPATHEAMYDIMCEIESRLDTFYNADYKLTVKFDKTLYALLAEQGASFRQAHKVLQNYLPLLKEIYSATYEPTEELKEAYEKMSEQELKNYSKFLFDICGEIRDYMDNHRITKKVRKTKSATELTKLVKYQKEDIGLKLRSIDPTEIIGSKALLCWNSKYSKMALLVAGPNEPLAVKGTTVLNYDEKKSVIKVFNSSDISRIMNGNLTYVQEYMKKHPYTPCYLTGRLGENTILLRVFK